MSVVLTYIQILNGHSSSTHAKFSGKLTFLTPRSKKSLIMSSSPKSLRECIVIQASDFFTFSLMQLQQHDFC